MSNKVKPLLSCEVDIDKVNFPIYISTKFDGIRCLVIDSVVYSRSLKPIRNKYVQQLFGKPEYNGFDGELIVGDIYAPDVFQKTTSGVMSTEGTPDVTFYVFDVFTNNLSTYKERLYDLNDRLVLEQYTNIVATTQRYVKTKEELLELLESERIKGGEGLIGRNPLGIYKYGRSTPKEQLSMKFKFFVDSEFEIVAVHEQMENTNTLEKDELGYAKRSTAKEGMVGKNTFGSFTCVTDDGKHFNVGTGVGLTQDLRQSIWSNKESYIGKLAKVKYMEVGSKGDVPRLPILLGFRDKEDMDA